MKKIYVFLILAACLIAVTGGKNSDADKWAASFTPISLKCEYRLHPFGIDVQRPELEWILEPATPSLRGLSQTAYQVLVSSSPELLKDNNGDLWNSGRIVSTQTNNIIYKGESLGSHQEVWWKVRVWDQAGNISAWSDASHWTMGILNQQDWRGAKWIGAPERLDSAVNSTFLLRREFSVKQGLKRAVVSVCGLGQYEMTLNGKPLTETLLNPGWTQYDKTCLYDTYNIAPLLSPGQNAIGLLLSNGMYRVKKGGRYAKLENNFGRLQAIAKIQFEYSDGSMETMVTDGSWKAGESPMLWSSIYGGEDWDARKVQSGWDRAGFNNPSWLPAEIMNGPGGELKGITHAAPPIKTFGVYKPVSKKQINSTTTIYDLGQNAAYICRFTVIGPAGSKIKVTPGELLNPDGSLLRNNYNGRSYSRYILAGAAEESYTSRFFNTGCRYYQVECLPAAEGGQLPVVKSIEGIVVHSDTPFTGEFSCSNELFNRAFKMIKWAELSNMKSVISDCPHRERLGWLEQSHLHGPSFRYNYDMRPLVGKIIHDMNDTQQPDGLIPCIAPELTVFGKDWREAIEWGTAGVMLPWQQYLWTGNVEVLRRNYPMMKRYVEYLTGKAKDGIAPIGKGDWSGRRASPYTSKEFIATAFYYANADVLAKSAKLIGDVEEAQKQVILAKGIYEVFNKAFFHSSTKQYDTGSQCANAMALVMNLVAPENRTAVINNLVADIENRNLENTTGEVGMRYMLRALADGGRSDVVYKMNNQDKQPGYGYQLKAGATALPETWDAYRDNSQNQFMLGHIIEWFYHDLAGIRMDPSQPGFRNFNIHPDIVGDLSEVKASYQSINGKIISEWKRSGNKLTMRVVVPVNTNATVYIPAKNSSAITENGRPVTKMQGGKPMELNGPRAVLKIGSGEYVFVCHLP